MTGADRLRFIEGMLDMAPYTLTGGEALKDLEAWDSLSTMLFIATVDRKLGLPLRGDRVTCCQTVNDLCALLGEMSAAQVA
jgi:hypothetical protein